MSCDEDTNEEETRMRFIDPQLKDAGWNSDLMRLEYIIGKGKIIPDGRKGKRSDPSIADYVLQVAPNYPIAIVEAKSCNLPHDKGMPQAHRYAEKMKINFAYATNGLKIEEYDFIKKEQKTIEKFPTPQELLKRLKDHEELDDQQMEVLLSPFDRSSRDPAGTAMEPRYYQEIAINATTSAILAGKKRILLNLATGTGKTFIAYQIAKKIWKTTSPHPKILFLADRNVLLDQAKNNSFESFGEARHRIQKHAETAYEMYFALYQSLDVDKEEGELYKQYDNDFFDYVIIDECHRGSSNEDGNWRKILEHFDSAVHIGMTATPKIDSENKDTYDYFGPPVYTYSLKQGIEDGFLAPYMIHRVNLDIDVKGYKPKPGEKDLDDKLLDTEKTYGYKDFDRILIVDERRKTVAKHLIDFMEKNGKYDKTILFCQNSEHAQAMTKLLRNYSGEEFKYCVRIVSDEGEIGREYLEHFQEINRDMPVIAVTSRLMSTGVDVPTCRVIALDKSINSMTEFKQIIGRGTRVFESKDKMWFTVIDYRKTSRHFEDKDWDGPPVSETEEEQQLITKEKEEKLLAKALKKRQEESTKEPKDPAKEPVKIETYHIEGDKVEIHGQWVYIFDQTMNKNRLISYEDFTGETVRRLVNDDERQLYQIWTDPEEKRPKFIKDLEHRGITFEHLKEITNLYKNDAFDLLLHFAFNAEAKTRYERVNNLKKKAFLEKYPEKAREVLEVILEHYGEEGYQELEGRDVLKLNKFEKFGGPTKIITNIFENGNEYDKIIIEITKELYSNN
jgi:type I restriction enzyme, R subunit